MRKMKLVTYDLNTPGQDYPAIHAAIKSLGDCYKPLESTWLINTNWSTHQIHQWLLNYIDRNDRLLIIDFDPSVVYGWLPTEANAWIQSRRR
jgi:hypothetical protein